MNIMNRWTDIGPEWKTDDIFRIREILREKHIPFKMPFTEVFFANFFNPPAKERRWGILVREKDLAKTAALLIREGLAWKELWVSFPGEPAPAESRERAARFFRPVPAQAKGKG